MRKAILGTVPNFLKWSQKIIVIGTSLTFTQPCLASHANPNDVSANQQAIETTFTGWTTRGAVPSLDGSPAQPLVLRCLSTGEDDLYIGLEQRMTIEAAFPAVEKTLDDVNGYMKLFPDYADIHIVSRDSDGNGFLTAWEQIVPLIPNVKFEMKYRVHRRIPDSKAYRYMLKLPNKDLSANDGLIIIAAAGEAHTSYYEIDFFRPNVTGLIATFAHKRIWNESIEGIALADLAIKLASENPGLAGSEIRPRAKEMLKRQRKTMDLAEQCVKTKRRRQ